VPQTGWCFGASVPRTGARARAVVVVGLLVNLVVPHDGATTMPQQFHNDSTMIPQIDTFTLKDLWLNKCLPFINAAGWLARRPVWNHVESSTLIHILIHDSTMIPHWPA
jgi:hypothetical protein